MAPRIHDADLCERIRKLEERVRELETRPPYTITYPPVWVYPYWNTTPVYHPWTVWSGTDSVSITSGVPDGYTYTALTD